MPAGVAYPTCRMKPELAMMLPGDQTEQEYAELEDNSPLRAI